MTASRHDLVVFGATSFVGQILCRYLAEQSGKGVPFDWALAGRSREKLAALRTSLGPGAEQLPLIVADAADEAALAKLCASTRVVISTVGPYALYGEPLVKACAQGGTDYCDLTGEVQWIRRMIERYETAAKASGARIVHCCGFDSIPSDLGVHFLQQRSLERFGQCCARVKMRVKATRGGLSGGTIASMLNVVKEARSNPQLRKELADPYSLCLGTGLEKLRQPEVSGAAFDADFDAWVAPFVMAAINTRIVLRTNALSAGSYGKDFRYDEGMLTGRGVRGRATAYGITAGLAGFMGAAALSPTRRFLERFFLPAPGEGPSPESQRTGFFDLRFLGTTPGGESLRVKVTGDRDPGYGSTGKMLGQAGLCLAQDFPKGSPAGGFWTPATLFGERLIVRLRARSGLAFDVV